jgi:hypothetical protein
MALADLVASLLLTTSIQTSKAVNDLSAVQKDIAALDHSLSLTFDTTGAGKISKVFHDSRTLGAAASEALNVSGGAHSSAVALLNPFAEAVTFTKILALVVKNTGAGDLILGGDTTDGVTTLLEANADGIQIRPGASVAFICSGNDATGYAVATDEILRLASTAGTTYSVAILGQ